MKAEFSLGDVRIDRDHTPDNLVGSCSKFRQRDDQERGVGAIQMRVTFVDFFPGRSKDLYLTEGRLDPFRKPDPNFVRGTLYCAAYSRLCLLEKGMRCEAGYSGQHDEQKESAGSFHLFPPNNGRPRLWGKRSSR